MVGGSRNRFVRRYPRVRLTAWGLSMLTVLFARPFYLPAPGVWLFGAAMLLAIAGGALGRIKNDSRFSELGLALAVMLYVGKWWLVFPAVWLASGFNGRAVWRPSAPVLDSSVAASRDALALGFWFAAIDLVKFLRIDFEWNATPWSVGLLVLGALLTVFIRRRGA